MPTRQREPSRLTLTRPSKPILGKSEKPDVLGASRTPEQENQEFVRSLARAAERDEPAEELLHRTGGSQAMPIASQLLHLQRQIGNRTLQQLLTPPRQEGHGPAAAPEIEAAIQRARGGGQALARDAREQMEAAFQADFGDVRIHTDTEADTLNRAVNARAFTVGSDIFFRQGEYKPGSSDGRELLAHELTHVVQQIGASVRAKLTVSQPGDRVEQEAEEVARAISRQEQQDISQRDAMNTWEGKLVSRMPKGATLQKKSSDAEQRSTDVPRAVIEHLKLREGWRETVYLDSRGLPTAGMGHLLTKKERQQYNVGDKIPRATLEIWAQVDTKKAFDAAVSQAAELGVSDQSFVNALASVNFQLGTAWNTVHKKTWGYMVAHEWEQAARETQKSLWNKQTPVRVQDFQIALRTLKKRGDTESTSSQTDPVSSANAEKPAKTKTTQTAMQLIEQHQSWGGLTLDEEGLGRALQQHLPTEWHLVHQVLNQLGESDRDDVSLAVLEAADSTDRLATIAKDPGSRGVLQRLVYELELGITTQRELTQIERARTVLDLVETESKKRTSTEKQANVEVVTFEFGARSGFWGHTALIVNGNVYSFEGGMDPKAPLLKGTGAWKYYGSIGDYWEKNLVTDGAYGQQMAIPKDDLVKLESELRKSVGTGTYAFSGQVCGSAAGRILQTVLPSLDIAHRPKELRKNLDATGAVVNVKIYPSKGTSE